MGQNNAAYMIGKLRYDIGPIPQPTQFDIVWLPDSVMPAQWNSCGGTLSGWRRLFGAILDDAEHTLRTCDPPTVRWRQAASWVAGEPAPISFHEVCCGLSLEEDYVRKLLMEPAKVKVRQHLPPSGWGRCPCGVAFPPSRTGGPRRLYCSERCRHRYKWRRIKARKRGLVYTLDWEVRPGKMIPPVRAEAPDVLGDLAARCGDCSSCASHVVGENQHGGASHRT